MQVRSVVSHDESLAGFLQALEPSGPKAALVCLLRATGYRCIGIFRVDSGRVQAVEVVNREVSLAPEVSTWPEVVERNCYLRDSQGRLVQAGAPDSGADDGTQSDCLAVPIMDPEGEILGTLCLYDPLPNDATPIELELLVVAVGALAGHDALRHH